MLTFDHVVNRLKDGKMCARKDWDENTGIVVVKDFHQPDRVMYYDKGLCSCWYPSSEDILADDWEVVEKT